MTDNALVVLTDEVIAKLAADMGASSDDLQGGGNFLPSLKVWMDEDSDEEGAPRLKGKMYIYGSDPIQFVKPNTIRFRPLTQTFQWTQWDKDAKKVTNRTRLIYNFREEARDEKGTLKCGKPPSKELKDNPALAALYENITTWRRLQGLVSFTAMDQDGKEIGPVENLLVALNLKGANFRGFDDEFVKAMPDGSNLWDFDTGITLSREKNGTVTYYVMHFQPNFAERLRFTLDIYNTINGLKKEIEEANAEVDQAYYDALNRKKGDDLAIDALKTVGGGRPGLNRGLSADLEDDDIPF